MENTYIVKVTNQAQEQMREIAYYITVELKNPEAALRLLDILKEAIVSLESLPQRVAFTGEQPWRNEGIRKLPVANFFVYFWIDEENRKVQVTAVVYKKRNQMRQLEQMTSNWY